MKRIYCKNCKYILNIGNSYVENYYICKFNKHLKTDPIGHLDIYDLEKCKRLNESYNCKCYKRKWWKFWVK